MEFEWNPDKANINLRKHGISFQEATTVFDDSWSVTGYQRKAGLMDIGCAVSISTLWRKDKRLCGRAQSPVSLPVRIQIGNDDFYYTRAATTGGRIPENAGSSDDTCDS